jgi:hypothetical protein
MKVNFKVPPIINDLKYTIGLLKKKFDFSSHYRYLCIRAEVQTQDLVLD